MTIKSEQHGHIQKMNELVEAHTRSMTDFAALNPKIKSSIERVESEGTSEGIQAHTNIHTNGHMNHAYTPRFEPSGLEEAPDA